MSVTDNSSKVYIGSNRAIVRSLFRRVTIVGPSKRPSSEFSLSTNKLVFLFDSIPGLFIKIFVPDLISVVSKVSIGWFQVFEGLVSPLQSLTHYNNVVTLSEGVSKICYRL